MSFVVVKEQNVLLKYLDNSTVSNDNSSRFIIRFCLVCISPSSKNHAIGNEMTSRRAQIAATLHGMHFGFSPPNYQQQPVQLGRPDAR